MTTPLTEEDRRIRVQHTRMGSCSMCRSLVEPDIQAMCLHVLLACPCASLEARITAMDSLLWLIQTDISRATALARSTGAEVTIVVKQTWNAWIARIGPASTLVLERHRKSKESA